MGLRPIRTLVNNDNNNNNNLTWVDGKSIDECKNCLLQNNKNSEQPDCLSDRNIWLAFDQTHPRLKPRSAVGNNNNNNNNDQNELLKQEIADQYRSFQILEHFLSNPILMDSQSLCIIGGDLQPVLVDKYWSLDDVFVRYLLF